MMVGAGSGPDQGRGLPTVDVELLSKHVQEVEADVDRVPPERVE
jgi:hypothetical protein